MLHAFVAIAVGINVAATSSASRPLTCPIQTAWISPPPQARVLLRSGLAREYMDHNVPVPFSHLRSTYVRDDRIHTWGSVVAGTTRRLTFRLPDGRTATVDTASLNPAGEAMRRAGLACGGSAPLGSARLRIASP
jgi:hypothetical protein